MHRFSSQIRQPVKRQGAEQYLLFTLLSFAVSVVFTRLFLDLTGYPRLETGSLHIAHVLWGGMLLFVASLLPLLLANRWALTASSILAGVGVGLFIDEVGKFITTSNDYFTPLAAPIIYAFFLITVLVYLQVRRPPSRNPRVELYHAIDALEEVLEHDLDQVEREELESRLIYVVEHGQNPVLVRLAVDLLEFLKYEKLTLAPRKPTVLERIQESWDRLEGRWLTRLRVKAGLTGGLLALGLVTLVNMTRNLPLGDNPTALETVLLQMIEGGQVTNSAGVTWFTFRLALETSVGGMLIVAAGLLIAGRDRLGTAIGYLSLLMSLTMVNLLVFYFEQFSAVVTATIQFWLLVGVLYYRQKYVLSPPTEGEDERS